MLHRIKIKNKRWFQYHKSTNLEDNKTDTMKTQDHRPLVKKLIQTFVGEKALIHYRIFTIINVKIHSPTSKLYNFHNFGGRQTIYSQNTQRLNILSASMKSWGL